MSLPMEKATYTARAFAVSFGESENHNKQIAVTFEIADEAFAGESITWTGTFTDKAAARTIESLTHMGWQGDDLSEFDGMDEAAVRAALPDPIALVCEPEEYDGQWRLKAQWVNRLGAGRFAFKKPVAGNDLKAFAAQMRATVKSVRGAGGAPRNTVAKPPNAAPHPNAPGSDDDIPF
jgi:hypothetical protein